MFARSSFALRVLVAVVVVAVALGLQAVLMVALLVSIA
jgi:hypothetical protein